jgi:hypothetical protein
MNSRWFSHAFPVLRGARRSRRPRRLSVALVVAALVAAGSAVAPPLANAAPTAVEAEGPPPPPQRHFGIGATVGMYSGFGVTAGGGGGFLRGWFTGSFMPVFVFANARTADRAGRVNYYSSYQINEDIGLRVLARPRLDGMVLLGYKFNYVLGSGGGVGFGVIHDLSRRVGLQLSAGVALFPSARDRLRSRGYPDDRDPRLVALQGGANVGLVFFP